MLLSGCTCGSSGDPAAELIRANRLEAAPDLERSLRVGLGRGVIYLGNEIDSDVARPGGSITVTHYLEVTAAPPDGARLVAGLAGDEHPVVAQPPSPMQRAYPPRAWKPGDIIRDRQVIEIPADVREPTAAVTVTFEGVEARVGRVAIDRGREYPVPAVAPVIAIDGDAGDPGWREAAWSPRFVTAKGGREVPGQARAKLAWDRDNLYVLVEVVDPAVFSPYSGRDDPLWKADVVEIFIDADRNRRGYVELQVNPRGAIFDAFFPVGRAQKHHFEWSSRMRAAVRVDGRADKTGSGDRGWVVEMAIPHGDVVGMAEDMAVTIPPEPGDRWNLNVVRVDKPEDAGISAATWNPITIRDFHAPARMLTVTFSR